MVATYPDMDLKSAKRIVQYIAEVNRMDISADTDERSVEELVKEALSLPPEKRDLYSIMEHLNVGPYRARQVLAAMKVFDGESYEEMRVSPEELSAHQKKALSESRFLRKEDIDLDDEHCVFCGKLTEYMHDCGVSMCPECEATHDYCPYCGKPLHPEKKKGGTKEKKEVKEARQPKKKPVEDDAEKGKKDDELLAALLEEGRENAAPEEDDEFRL